MSSLLRPDNDELWRHVRLMAIMREPVMSWEDIARAVGLDATDVPELLAWFIAYRLPPVPRVHPTPVGARPPRDPAGHAEYLRLRRREESLVTVASEAPRQLAVIQSKIQGLERVR